MKVKDIIKELEAINPDSEVTISVYDCGGFNDSYSIDGIEFWSYDNTAGVNLELNAGCDTHRKWVSDQNCPVDKLQKEIKLVDELKKRLDYYKVEIEKLELRFKERNQK